MIFFFNYTKISNFETCIKDANFRKIGISLASIGSHGSYRGILIFPILEPDQQYSLYYSFPATKCPNEQITKKELQENWCRNMLSRDDPSLNLIFCIDR